MNVIDIANQLRNILSEDSITHTTKKVLDMGILSMNEAAIKTHFHVDAKIINGRLLLISQDPTFRKGTYPTPIPTSSKAKASGDVLQTLSDSESLSSDGSMSDASDEIEGETDKKMIASNLKSMQQSLMSVRDKVPERKSGKVKNLPKNATVNLRKFITACKSHTKFMTQHDKLTSKLQSKSADLLEKLVQCETLVDEHMPTAESLTKKRKRYP